MPVQYPIHNPAAIKRARDKRERRAARKRQAWKNMKAAFAAARER